MKAFFKIFTFFLFLTFSLQSYSSRIYIPIDTIIKKCPLIVEGKVVSIPPAYWGGQMIYTSYVVQVYKIFKGDINTTFIEIPLEGGIVGNDILSIPSCGTLSLAGLGQTGIFFLNNPNISDSTANKKFLSSGDTLAKNFIVRAFYDTWVYQNNANTEKDVYCHIEALTKIKRKIISRPEVEDATVKNWLISSGNAGLLQSQGVALNFKYAELGKNQTIFDLCIEVKSTVSFVALKTLEFAVKYNTETFGTFVVRNKNIEFNNSKLNFDKKWLRISKSLLGDTAYTTQISDLDSSTILISIKSLKKSKHVFEIGKQIVALLRFNIKNFDSTSTFSFPIEFANGKFYDYENNSISKLSYVFCNQEIDVTPHSLLLPIINNFSPDTILCGEKEILTVTGMNFLSDKTRLIIGCAKDGCSFNAIIPHTKFISLTATTIVTYIPCELNVGGSACGSTFPTISGFYVGKENLSPEILSPRKLYIQHK